MGAPITTKRAVARDRGKARLHGTMGRRQRDYFVNFLVTRDGNQYSALCYEYNVAGCGRTVREALLDLMGATITYLEFFLERGKEPEPRPASRELLLEFLDLDPDKASFTRDELGKVLACCHGGAARLRAPLVYYLDRKRFATPLSDAMTSPRTGSYPVAIRHA